MTSHSGRAAVKQASVLVVLIAALLLPSPRLAANHEGRTLQVSPETDRNPLGTLHVLTATISPPAGDEGSVLIDWKITSGPNAVAATANDLTKPDWTCTIPSGATTCTYPYTDRRAFAGTDNIIAWIDHDGDNATVEADTGEFYNAGGPPDEPGCPELQCGPPDDSGAGDTTEPDSTDVVLKEWGQLKTAMLPYIDGSLEPSDPFCATEKDRSGGTLAATVKGCSFAFLFPASEETDADNDYGAFWVQSSVDARKGWCATKVVTKLPIPDGAAMRSFAPPSLADATQRRVDVASLQVGDLASAGSLALLEQSFFSYPGTLKAKQNKAGTLVKIVWKGSSRARLAFALGMEVSWDADDGPPAGPAASIDRRIVKSRRC